MQSKRQPLNLCGDWDPEFPVHAFFNAWSDGSLPGSQPGKVKSYVRAHCRVSPIDQRK
jgi:hypothetical protein